MEFKTGSYLIKPGNEVGIGSEYGNCTIEFSGEGNLINFANEEGEILCSFEYEELLAILRAVESKIDVDRSKALLEEEKQKIRNR